MRTKMKNKTSEMLKVDDKLKIGSGPNLIESKREEARSLSDSSDGERGSASESGDCTLSRSYSGDDSMFDDRYSTDGNDAIQEYFDQDLRLKHTAACKHMKHGEFELALKEFETILAAMYKQYGKVHDRVGAALHNVGIANLRAGRLEDAMDAIEEAVRIRKLTLGSEDPKVADSLVELGIVLLSMKEYSDALEIFYEALELREVEADDALHPEAVEASMKIAKVLNNIGCVNFERGSFSEANKSFRKAVSLQKEAFGDIQSYDGTTPTPGVLTMATTMCNLGYVMLERAEFTEASKIFEESLKIQKCFLGADNKLILNTLDNMGFAYAMRRSYDKALKVYEALLANQQKSYEETQLNCAATLRKLAYVRIRLHQYEQCLRDLCLLEDIQLENFGPDSQQLNQTQELMGQVNYEVLKFPSFAESVARSFKGLRFLGSACTSGHDAENDGIDLREWSPQKPLNNSKMSGHRITYA